jgi:hypothetical protein
VFDATQKMNAGPFSLPSMDYMTRALTTWKEAGLPEVVLTKRARLRFEKA